MSQKKKLFRNFNFAIFTLFFLQSASLAFAVIDPASECDREQISDAESALCDLGESDSKIESSHFLFYSILTGVVVLTISPVLFKLHKMWVSAQNRRLIELEKINQQKSWDDKFNLKAGAELDQRKIQGFYDSTPLAPISKANLMFDLDKLNEEHPVMDMTNFKFHQLAEGEYKEKFYPRNEDMINPIHYRGAMHANFWRGRKDPDFPDPVQESIQERQPEIFLQPGVSASTTDYTKYLMHKNRKSVPK